MSSSINKIFNDPVYGFISFPFENLYRVIDSFEFQRLRRISQMGLSFLVYPGAVHTRFHHTLGALHLMSKAIYHLQSIGIDISKEEANAACMAILCHDIGHGPYSHTLEGEIVNKSHEELSIAIMQRLRTKMPEDRTVFDLAIDIFLGIHPKKFLHQLVSSQLDVDRLDYLTRDSFFTGVVEGSVGYDRIIHMLNVHDNTLVVEEKGLYSVEKFLMARRTMYWQVYLHKTSLVAEKMLLKAIQRCKFLLSQGASVGGTDSFLFLMESTSKSDCNEQLILSHFLQLDDTDIIYFLKSNMDNSDRILSILCSGIISRKLFKVKLSDRMPGEAHIFYIHEAVRKEYGVSDADLDYLVYFGEEGNQSYNAERDSILIKLKDGGIKSVSSMSSFFTTGERSSKYYLCYPKDILI